MKKNIGALTCGILIILMGILAGINIFYDVPIKPHHIWPLLLIGIGIEILFSKISEAKELKFSYGIIILTIILLISSQVFYSFEAVNPFFKIWNYQYNGGQKIDVSESKEITSEIKNIYVNTRLSTIKIQKSNDNNIRVAWEITGRSYKPFNSKIINLTTEGQLLKITQDDDLSSIDFGKNEIIIYIPEELTMNSIDLYTNLGSIEVSNIKADKLTVKTNMGSVELKDNQIISYIEAYTDMGSIALKGDLSNASIDASTNLGSIQVSDNSGRTTKGNSFSAVNGSGNLKVKLLTHMGGIEINK